jgi:hypothetical protein
MPAQQINSAAMINGNWHNEHRAVPPGHRDSVLVLLVAQMVAVVPLKNVMMDQRMPFRRITKSWTGLCMTNRCSAHSKNDAKNRTKHEPHPGPEKKRNHLNNSD